MSINRKVQVLFVLFSFLAAVVRPQEDYCNPDLCESGVSNIGCGATNELSSDCVDAKKYTFDDKLKKILLDEHNKYRNQVAKGELDWLPKAANMVTMDWDDDLAYLAELNANKCLFEHDKCHNTKKYPDSGQNIASWGTSGDDIDVESTLKTLVQEWWDERHFATPKLMKKLFDKEKALHFTMLVRSNASRVGCGMVKYRSGEWLWVQLVCNYSYTNMIGTPVYTAGEPCSQCKTGCDATYDGLCNKDEPVDVGA
ncbi:venom allergen 5 [Culex quinquefasciatus]|uniref:Venom allergen 5 n=2 Tax=Culex pipiens complex TaxID=518105 RepID=B0X6A4_CULQU|nr:venom allergen 5 [Culex pipiens pallens]EDS41254.1 venom allergen 5 [Culex quinquefasciatus]|eukprot:XP_001865176.1 venom allergen 5 [Culex quinquefasciatus]